MNFKIIGYIGAGLLILVLIGGIGWKLIAKTEGYRAQEQNFYSFEPHFFLPGCANYNVIKENTVKKGEVPAQKQATVKKNVK